MAEPATDTRSDTATGTGAATTRAVAALEARLPAGVLEDADEILDRFLGWVGDLGFDLYPAQEEALLELMAGRHVVLATPTGSGKSLVAQGLHFKGLCEGRRSFYTSPIKALASEKFFQLCDELGPARVGMLTGDASINSEAPVICCTAEVLANMALRRGEDLDAPYVVMDEFHYYSDPDRGVAWQVPLITLPRTRFLLMSATLGDVTGIAESLEAETGAGVAVVTSVERPVPLDFEYRETPIHESVQWLLDTRRAPIYVVNFTQRECAEMAQSLTSMGVASRDARDQVLEAMRGFRFDTAYGKELRRFLTFGIGVHHAGLLPKYRLLVEQLSQQGLLKIICGTDTLGVGVNIPIRTVLFSKLAKYDGHKVRILSVRDFKQIAGRAGRKGFDDEGSVVAQAPEHVIENKRLAEKAAENPGKAKKFLKRKKQPQKGEVGWSKETFESLIQRAPETLRSRFRLGHGLVLHLIQQDAERNDPERDNFHSLRRILAHCHEDDGTKERLRTEAAQLVRSLYRAGILRLEKDQHSGYRWVVVNEDLQWDFSLHHALSLFLVEAVECLDAQSPTYALDVVSVTEAVLESPRVILLHQVKQAKGELVQELKAEGMDFEDRMARLDEVEPPTPPEGLTRFLEESFDVFRRAHPWVVGSRIQPKVIGREMAEMWMTFGDFVKRYGLQRSEGVLLRYVSQLYKTLDQTVPDHAKTDELIDVVAFFRALLERTDTSLLEEWESLLHPDLKGTDRSHRIADEMRAHELLDDPKAFRARVRAEVHQLVAALARRDFEEASLLVRQPAAWDRDGDQEPPPEAWPAERIEAALEPFFAAYDEILFLPEARQAHWTRLEETSERLWEVTQVLLDPEGDNLWHVAADVDLRDPEELEGPLLRLRDIGT